MAGFGLSRIQGETLALHSRIDTSETPSPSPCKETAEAEEGCAEGTHAIERTPVRQKKNGNNMAPQYTTELSETARDARGFA